MSYLEPLIKWLLGIIVPKLMSLAEKYIPILLDNLIEKIIHKKDDAKMATIKIITTNDSGTALAGVSVVVKVEGSDITYTSDSSGIIEKSGFTSGTTYTFTGTLTGYTSASVDVIASDDGVTSGTIKMVSSVSTAESTVASAITTASTSTTTTASEDWKTIKAAAESVLSTLVSSVSSADLTDSSVLTTLYSQVTTVIQTAITKVETYKSALMVSRHSLGLAACLKIDAKLIGITVFEYYVNKELSKIKTKLGIS